MFTEARLAPPAMPYDLATPPEAERIGLDAMVRFIDQPQQMNAILADTSTRLAACFAARKAAGPPAPR